MINDAVDYSVAVVCETDNGFSCGTGFPIGDGLVLTAGHVVADVSGEKQRELYFGEISLCWWYSDAEGYGHTKRKDLTANYKLNPVAGPNRGIVWLDKDLDVALISCGAPAGYPFAKITQSIPDHHSKFVSVGFPKIARINGIATAIPIEGTIHPEANNKFVIYINKPEADDWDEGKSPFSGLSGAAVQHRGKVIGLVRRNIRYEKTDFLATTSIADVLTNLKADKKDIPPDIYQKLFPDSYASARLRQNVLSILKAAPVTASTILSKQISRPSAPLPDEELADKILGLTAEEVSEAVLAIYRENPARSAVEDTVEKLINRLFSARLFVGHIANITELRQFDQHNFIDIGIGTPTAAEVIAAGVEERSVQFKDSSVRWPVGENCCECPPECASEPNPENLIIGDIGKAAGSDIKYQLLKSVNKQKGIYRGEADTNIRRNHLVDMIDEEMTEESEQVGFTRPYMLFEGGASSPDCREEWQNTCSKISWMDFYVLDQDRQREDRRMLKPLRDILRTRSQIHD